MKKKLLILLVLLLILVAGVLGYAYFAGGTNPDGTKQNPLTNLFPFGKPSESTSGGNTVGSSTDTYPNVSSTSTASTSLFSNGGAKDFILISSTPVAGFHAILKTDDNTIVRYTDKATGNIFETDIKSLKKTRISDAQIPGLYDALWSESGKYLIVRYLADDGKTIKSYLVNLSTYTPGTPYQLSGKYLPDNIQDFSLYSDTDKALYLQKTSGGSSVSVVNFINGSTAPLFSSPFSEWLVQRTNDGTIALTTRASQGIPGYLYKLTPGSSNLEKILDGVPGLTTLVSPDFHYVLYSESTDQGDLTLNLYNVQQQTSVTLSAKTLPDKCVWANTAVFYCGVPKNLPLGTYPDDWYQGRADFDDTLMKFGVDSSSPLATYDLATPVNITNLNITGNYAYFIDKKTSSLWAKRVATSD
ncbi:MAG TPA: hypothetical protein VFM02_00470 [Candidatus Paceibacterota bacterium]|nr:hypothetical protein [Candidatus Paceibacterota bacterium]